LGSSVLKGGAGIGTLHSGHRSIVVNGGVAYMVAAVDQGEVLLCEGNCSGMTDDAENAASSDGCGEGSKWGSSAPAAPSPVLRKTPGKPNFHHILVTKHEGESNGVEILSQDGDETNVQRHCYWPSVS
jgi:hypothetical protein